MDSKTARQLDAYLTTDPYDGTPADLGTDHPTIDAATIDAATTNAAATENHRRADALAARLESADRPMLMDALAALAQRNYRTAAQILIDVIDGV